MHVLSAILVVFWAIVFVQTIANLLDTPRLRRSVPLSREPFVSIVVPARNEARSIERAVRGFLAQAYSNFEVIVVNDRSTDETGDILRSIRDPRLTVIDTAETPPGWLGKPWALQQGSERAHGEILLFVDADLIYAPDALGAFVGELERSSAAVLSVFPHFDMRTFGEHSAMPMIAFFGFCITPLWWSNRSLSPRLAVGGGSGNMIRRSTFEAIGGFSSLRKAVVDDISLARLARKRGDATRTVRADDLISVRMYHGLGELVEGFTKNLFAGMDRSFLRAALFLPLFVAGNLLPYAVACTGDPFAIATIMLIPLSRFIVFRSLRYRLDNAIFLHPVMCTIWAYIFLRSIWFTGVRNELRWRGRTYDAAQTRFGA